MDLSIPKYTYFYEQITINSKKFDYMKPLHDQSITFDLQCTYCKNTY